MIDKFSQLVAAQDVGTWLIVALLIGYFVYKEWPDFKSRITSGTLRDRQMEETDESLAGRLDRLEASLKEVNEKLDRDYRRLNDFERWQRRAQLLNEESAEERALMMKGMLACLEGLQQLGANGNTTDIKTELNTFLIKTSHNKGKENS